MYWEQLELRCRSLYTGSQAPPPQVASSSSMIGTQRGLPCRCCEQCHSHRNVIPSTYPWDGDSRFWGPVPGQATNFYSPNPVSDDNVIAVNQNNQVTTRNQRPGWSWPRLPWQRNVSQRFRQTPSSPDSQYGFSNGNNFSESTNMQSQSIQNGYSVIGGPTQYGIWGPPPPYSDPNSPARRSRYQYVHPLQCQEIIDHSNVIPQSSNLTILECHQHNSVDNHSRESLSSQHQPQLQLDNRSTIKRTNVFKPKDQYETPSDNETLRDRFSNTLPIRKVKKRSDVDVKSIGPNQKPARVNVQNIFSTSSPASAIVAQQSFAHENGIFHHDEISDQIHYCKPSLAKQKLGIENSAFVKAEKIGDAKDIEPTESEIYFADVSSCCNMSDKNDHFYDETKQHLWQCINSNTIPNNSNVIDDYLVQRFGKREASKHCHLSLSQMAEDYKKPQMNIPINLTGSRQSSIHKDISRQSVCSVDSGEKTDFTDLSPITPSSSGFSNAAYKIEENITESLNFQHVFPNSQFMQNINSKYLNILDHILMFRINSNLISDTPLSFHNSSSCTESDMLQTSTANRRIIVKPSINNESVGNCRNEIYLLPDAKYVIEKTSAAKSSSSAPLTLNYEHQDMSTSYKGKNGNNVNNQQKPQQMSSHYYLQKPKSPKNINITPIKRQSLGTSTIIENSSSNVDSGTWKIEKKITNYNKKTVLIVKH